MSLPPPPIELTRQVGITGPGSPIVLSRSTSELSHRSEIGSADTVLRSRLEVYLTSLQHDIDFVANEIQALIDRPPSSDQVQEEMFLDLRDRLKVRFNSLQVKKERVLALLEVL